MSQRLFEKTRKQYYNVEELVMLNNLMGSLNKKGKKNWSLKIVIKTLFLLKKYTKKEPLNKLYKVINEIKPDIILFKKKRGTVSYELPRLLTIEKSNKQAIQWLIKEKTKEKKTLNKIIIEIRKITKKTGNLKKKKENIEKIAKSNQAFFYMLKRR